MTLDTTAPVPPGGGSGVGPTGPEHSARPDRPAWARGAVIGGAVACGCAAIALVDPTDAGVPVCWSAGLFGVDCPLCGGLRCVNALVRGNWFAAADHNLVLAVTLPLVVVGWAVWMLASLRGRPWRLPSLRPWVWSILAVVVLAFTVVRNLDLGPVAHYLAATAG